MPKGLNLKNKKIKGVNEMKKQDYQPLKLKISRLAEDCIRTSGEGIATDVQYWIDKGDLFKGEGA